MSSKTTTFLRYRTLGEGIESVAKRFPHRPALLCRSSMHVPFAPVNWKTFSEDIARLARALLAANLTKGDLISVLSENRREWITVDLAALSIGVANAPLFAGDVPPDIAYKLNDTRSRLLFLSTHAQLEKILSVESELRYLQQIVAFDPVHNTTRFQVLAYDEFLRRAHEVDTQEWSSAAARVHTDDLAMVIYTSGSTGDPKGSMLTHGNILHDQEGVRAVFSIINEHDVFLNYLPWHHSYGGQYERFLALLNGACIAIADGPDIDTLIRNFGEVQPTVFFSVPLNLERLKAKTEPDTPEAQSARRAVFHPKVKLFNTGGVSLDKEIIEYYVNKGIQISETYGLTEVGPVLTINLGGPAGSVGKPIPGVDLKIIHPESGRALPPQQSGEVVVRGKNVMEGYLRKPTLTREAIRRGWFYTGDRGWVNEEGVLTINGRYKNLIIPKTGENISPEKIENVLKGRSPFIAQAVAVGDGQKYIAALIQPNFELLRQWASKARLPGTSFDDLVTHEKTRRFFAELVAHINDDPDLLRKYEKVKRLALLTIPFSQEGGELTSSLKVRRYAVLDKYKELIHNIYSADPGPTVVIVEAPAFTLAGK